MKDIILINCPPWSIDRPPLGIHSLNSFLKSKGIISDVIDINLMTYKQYQQYSYFWDMNNHEIWLDFNKLKIALPNLQMFIKKLAQKIVKQNTKMIGFSSASPKEFFTIELIKEIKMINSKHKIVVGGPTLTTLAGVNSYQDNIPFLIDAYIVGEAESSLLELIKNFSSNIPGVIYNNKGKLSELKSRLLEKNLDKFNFPKYESVKLQNYSNSRSLDIEWSRGCISKCAFCGVPAINGYYRFKSAEKRIEELIYHYKNNKIKSFSLTDSTINGNIKELEKTCDLIIKNKLKINWSGQIIPRKEMTSQLYKKMKKAGCKRLEFGIESGSNEILKKMGKIHSVEDSVKNLRFSKSAGIETVIFLIVGFPRETNNDFQKTINFIEKNKQYIDLVRSVRQPYLVQGATMSNNKKKFGIKENNDKMSVKWNSKKNTFKERMKKIKFLIEKLNKFQIPYELYDQEELMEDTDILLVNPPPWGVEDPPTGIANIATFLKNKRIKVSCYDINIELFNKVPKELKLLWHVENKNFWKNSKTFQKLVKIFKEFIDLSVKKIVNYNAPIIALNVVDPKERITIELIKRIKQKLPNTNILLGGPGTYTEEARSWFTNEIPNLVSGFIIGEGEETLYETVNALLKNQSIKKIPGLLINHNIKEFKPRKLLSINKQNLWPTYEEFNLDEYHSDLLRIEWSRGCISKCVFCKGKTLNPGYRFRNPKSIVDELEYHVKHNNIRKFVVVDLTVNGNLKKLEEVCDLIIKRKLNIKWLAEGIPRANMNSELWTKIKKSGCYEFQFGLESGSDKILKLMKKKHLVKEAENCIKKASKTGIRVGLFILVGFPGETEKDFDMTLDFIKKNTKYISYIKSINAVHLIEDTDLKDNHKKYGVVLSKKKSGKEPEEGIHYKWKTKDGNTWKIRKTRMNKIYSLLTNLNIPLVETNYDEGKENKESQNLIRTINKLQDLNNFTNMGLQIKKKPIKLFFECLNEHGFIYTLDHMIKYLKK